MNILGIFEVNFENVANFRIICDVPREILHKVLYSLEFTVGKVLPHCPSVQIIYIVIHKVCSGLSRIVVGDIRRSFNK